MSKYRTIKVASLVGAACAVAAIAFAAVPADVIKERQDGLKAMGKAFKAVNDEMKAGNLSPATVNDASAKISKVTEGMPHWFPKGSGPEAGVKTAAKPEIWSDSSEFDAAQKKLAEAGAKFAEVAKSGDMSAVPGGVRGLGGACKNCHDKFRVKED